MPFFVVGVYEATYALGMLGKHQKTVTFDVVQFN
jgi:hypothetical protein